MQTHVLTAFEPGAGPSSGALRSRKEVRVESRNDNGGAPAGGVPAASPGDALGVVLERTRRGEDELARPLFGLGASRLRLLAAIDGRSSLDALAAADAQLVRQRLVRDAARLVAFGLARQVRGELPREYLVAAMNLTVRIPRPALLAQGAGKAAERAAAPEASAAAAPVQRPADARTDRRAERPATQRPAARRGDATRLVVAFVIAAVVVAVALYAARL